MPNTKKQSAYQKSIRLLARREHSKLELIRQLKQAKFPQAEIDEVLDKLEQQGYLSEIRFTAAYLRSRALRGMGPLKIQYELKEKGIDLALIQQAFIEFEQEFDWNDSFFHLVKRRFPNIESLSLYSAEGQKLARFVAQRGFPTEWLHRLCKNL